MTSIYARISKWRLIHFYLCKGFDNITYKTECMCYWWIHKLCVWSNYMTNLLCVPFCQNILGLDLELNELADVSFLVSSLVYLFKNKKQDFLRVHLTLNSWWAPLAPRTSKVTYKTALIAYKTVSDMSPQHFNMFIFRFEWTKAQRISPTTNAKFVALHWAFCIFSSKWFIYIAILSSLRSTPLKGVLYPRPIL